MYGDSKQSSLVGVIVPDKDAFIPWAQQNGFDTLSKEELYTSPEVKKQVLQALNVYGKENDLKGFEQIRAVYLTADEFTIDNDLLTPTFKLKREIARKVFSKQIEEMYATISNGRNFN